jgi:hypothetical protein
LHELLHNLNFYHDEIKENVMGEGFSTRANAYKIFYRKLKGQRPLGKSRRRWKVDIKIYLLK